MNAKEISNLLNERVVEVCLLLFPNGKKQGNEWCVGDLNGAQGESLKIRLSGAKAGVWSDFAGHSKGDLIQLWIESKRVSFKEAMVQIKDFLNIKDDHHIKPMFEKKPRPVISKAGLAKLSKTKTYLESRGLNQQTLETYKVCETKEGDVITFPYFDADGNLVMLKFMAVARENGKKKIWTSKDGIKCLFGKSAIPDSATELVITEGEIDAMTCWQLGIPAVSVPFGAKKEGRDGTDPNMDWISEDFEWLDRFVKITLCFDADEVGQSAAGSIIKRLGRDRCHLVKMPSGVKDANQALMENKSSLLLSAIQQSETVDPSHMKNVSHFELDIWKKLNREDDSEKGIPFIFDIPFQIRRGEVTVWTGYSGSGKSTMLLQTVVHLADYGERIYIASLEMPPKNTGAIMFKQYLKKDIPSHDEFRKVMDDLQDKIWIYDWVGKADWKKLLDDMRYAVKRYNIRQFVIDSLLKFGIAHDDYKQQNEFVSALTDFSNETGGHVHLVAHARKGEDESHIPQKHDVKGSGDITDLCFNGITVWRNKTKESDMCIAEQKNDQAVINKLRVTRDGAISIWKQRETGHEPAASVMYNNKTMVFEVQKYGY